MSSFRDGPSGRIADFTVIESFAGSVSKIATVRTGFGAGDCGFDFKVGKTYLVYAGSTKDQGLGTGICSRTREIERATEDIEILRELKAGSAKSKSRLFGNVVRVSKEPEYKYTSSPLSGAKVVATGINRKVFETQTDANGNYVFRQLPPGTYDLRLLYGPNFEKTERIQIGTAPKDQCVEQGFFTWAGPRATGKVTDDKGKPIIHIRVIAAYYRDPGDEHSWEWFEGYSDEAGRFEIEGLTQGTYTIGVNFDGPTKKKFPFPATFYPGVTDTDLAKRISITEEKSYDGFDLTLGPRLIPRAVSGLVVFPDGKPARGARVLLKESETTWTMDEAKIDATGRFTLSAFDGFNYSLYVYKDFESWGMNREVKQVAIPEHGLIESLKFTVPFPKPR